MKVTIGEREFTLKYNNRALFRIEKELDKPVVQVFTNEQELQKMHTIFVIVYAGIQEDITFDEFTDLAGFQDFEEILPKVIEVIGESFNTGVKKKKPKVVA
jgi:hypothetical protein|tara:strand:- start:108 stop:410 length:303 start_codon:yes stop_codon:yes gene_type:complete